ncbi:MAG: tetratricopeptide repeat protein [Pirellulaceae bacterium]
MSNEPITARPPSKMEQLRRWVKRNRTLSIALSTIFVLLLSMVSFATVSAIVFRGIAEEKNALVEQLQTLAGREKTQRMQAEEISNYLQSIFEATGPIPAELSLIAALDQAVEKLEPRSIKDPSIRFKLLASLGKAYHANGQPHAACELFKAALEIDRNGGTVDDEAWREVRHLLYDTLKRIDRPAAIQLGGQLLEEQLARHGAEHVESVNLLLSLELLRNDPNRLRQAVEQVRHHIDKYPKSIGALETIQVSAIEQLGMAYVYLRQFDDAERLYHGFIDHARKGADADPELAVTTYLKAAWMYQAGKQYEKSIAFGKEAVDLGKRKLGELNSDTLWAMDMLWSTYQTAGQYDEAKRVADEVLELSRRKFGEKHAEVQRLCERRKALLQRMQRARDRQ